MRRGSNDTKSLFWGASSSGSLACLFLRQKISGTATITMAARHEAQTRSEMYKNCPGPGDLDRGIVDRRVIMGLRTHMERCGTSMIRIKHSEDTVVKWSEAFLHLVCKRTQDSQRNPRRASP